MAMNQVRVSHLRFAQQVAATGSFSAAARACGVSQPTVSEAVAAVEEALGGRLFARTTRQVTLTPFGAALLERIGSVIAAVDALDGEAERLRTPADKQIRIGYSSVVDLRRLHRLVEPFRAERPDVELVYKECTNDELAARLSAQGCEVAIRVRTGRARSSFVLYRDPLRYLPRGGGRLGASVDLRTVAAEPLVFTIGNCGLAPATRRLFRDAGLPITEVPGQALSYAALEEWSALGIGAAILPESRVAQDVGRLPVIEVDGRPAELTIEAALNPDAVRTEHGTEFTRCLRRAATA